MCKKQEQTTRKLKQETYAQLSAKQHKLDMLKNIINQDSDNGSTNARLRNTGNNDVHTCIHAQLSAKRHKLDMLKNIINLPLP